jgi:bifunctional DNA-binding transcriptional regulator/antitoxin component of YhaV-PrlF toxin-antitoxin module
MLSQDFKEFIELLNDNNVSYLVVGGYAVAFHGHPRYTKDLDVWIELSLNNSKKVLNALAAFRGQTVIPAEIRRRFQLDPSKKLEWIVDENGITVVPVKANPIEAIRGQGKGGFIRRLFHDLRRNRARE